MNIVHTLESIEDCSNSIFLAGPTHRVREGQTKFNRSWRSDAIGIFNNLCFSGTLFIPEWKDNVKPTDWTYSKQVMWEVHYLKRASVVMFWIPRNLKDLPAFTTNVEFGEYLSANSVAGSPTNAEKNEYLKERFRLLGKPWFDSLEDTCKYSILKTRFRGDCGVVISRAANEVKDLLND